MRAFFCGLVAFGLAMTANAESYRPTVTQTSEDTISALCLEADSGMILYEQNADIPRPPASMLKLMMMLKVTEGLDAGLWTLETPITVSADAASMGGTQVYLKAGETWPLGQLMEACAVASANDASHAIAEGLWGSTTGYLKAMNARARELGMMDTEFHSVHGLPPNPGEAFDRTTAYDMALLARACLKHPYIRQLVGTHEIQFRPTDAPKSNTNKLLGRTAGCDGLKTGYIRAAGFCIAATAERDGVRLISIVMGCPSKWGRFNLAEQLLDEGFQRVKRVRVLAGGESTIDPVPVFNCAKSEMPLTAAEDVWVTIKTEDLARIEYSAVYPSPLMPPLEAATVVGELRVRLDGQLLGASPLLVGEDLEPLGWHLSLVNGVAKWVGLDREHLN